MKAGEAYITSTLCLGGIIENIIYEWVFKCGGEIRYSSKWTSKAFRSKNNLLFEKKRGKLLQNRR
jgi:hypothetical protein